MVERLVYTEKAVGPIPTLPTICLTDINYLLVWNIMTKNRFLLIGISLSFIIGLGIYFAKDVPSDASSVRQNLLGDLSAVAGNNTSTKNTKSAALSVNSCSFETSEAPKHSTVILNELAWMGSVDSANDEWMELKNISSGAVDARGWHLLNRDGKIKIVLGSGANIPSGGFYLLGRRQIIAGGVKVDMVYQGILRNGGDSLRLFDKDCHLIDEVMADSGWPAGNNADKKTMERDSATFLWHTSALAGGTPKKENTSSQKPNTSAQSAPSQQSTSSATTNATTASSTVINQTATSSAPLCPQNGPRTFSHSVLINEVAWAGTASDKTSHEWIELKNNSALQIYLEGWQIQNAGQNIKVFFVASDTIATGGFYLLERGNVDFLSGIRADKFFMNTIKNKDEAVRLFDKDCNIIDEVIANVGSGKNWPAGTASPDYRTAERSSDLSWHTYSGSGTNGIFGTPRAENSPPAAIVAQSQATTTPSPQQLSPPPQSPSPAPQPSNSTSRLLISEIMIGIDGSSNYTFIEFYNPTASPIDLTSWAVKKKTSTGTESSLIVSDRLRDKIVQPGKYFLAANDAGYTGSVPPDVRWPSSYTLAYANNSITIYDGSNAAVDSIRWDNIPKNQSYERDSWSSNIFHLQPTPNPQDSGSQ